MKKYLIALGGWSCVFLLSALIARADFPPPGTDGPSERAYEVAVLVKVVDPVLKAGAEGKLAQLLPPSDPKRESFAPLEALGRTLAGIAPWLELGPGTDAEGQLRAKYIDLAVKSIGHAVDPQSPAFMNFTKGQQPLVDCGFLAQALLRAPKQLWGNLDDKTRKQLVDALKSSRVYKPGANNWVLFSAEVEAALLEYTGECDMAPIETAINDHLLWYKGDGVYGDGNSFHWDYYNSFVIQPMLWDVLEVCDEKKLPLAQNYGRIQKRAQRYALEQERLISPEATYPIIGRSSVYRFGAFQNLAMIALRHQLPNNLPPGGVRAALNAVIHRMIEAPGTFDDHGWLTIGVIGAQPKMAESYISRGSVFLCTEGLLQLGLPATDPFWTSPDEPWTQKRIWSGEDMPADHAKD